MAILLIGWLVLYVWDLKKNSAGKTLGVDSKTPSVEEAELDTDADGLRDWEEILWKTNMHHPDSDGDGTWDGDEVARGRNPAIAGVCPSSDSINSEATECSDQLKSLEKLVDETDENAPGTLTAQIAQEFSKNYFAGKGLVEGDFLSATAQQSLADSLVLGVEQGIASYQDVFKKKDLDVSETLAPRDYLNALGAIHQKNFAGINDSELDILEAIVTEQYFADISRFDPLVSAYEKMVKSLRAQSVPPSYAELHLAALNIMQNTLYATRNMRAIGEDPAKAIVGVRLYAREQDRAQEFLKKLGEQIKKDNLTFNKNEGGYFFSQYFNEI